MAKYTTDEGLYKAREYQREYRQNHKDTAALWRLKAALIEAAKYPNRRNDVLRIIQEYTPTIAGGGADE